jgi:hypothetical protein
MRSRLAVSAAVILMVSGGPEASAQSSVPYNQRVTWTAPPSALDSTTVQVLVVDVDTGRPVPALLCFRAGTEVVTDSQGEVRVSGLGRRNVQASILASGYAQTSLIFQPGMRGRSYVKVRLVSNSSAPASPSCRDAIWPV